MTKNNNMMKKIFFLVSLLVLIVTNSFSQGYPLTQFIGTDSALVVSKGGLQGRLVNVVFSDTSAANLQRIRQYPGAQIVTNGAGMKIWLRNADATRWLQIPAGSGVGNIYTIDGTLTGNRELDGDGNTLSFTAVRKFEFSGDSLYYLLDSTGNLRIKLGAQQLTMQGDTASLSRRLSYTGNLGNTFTQYSLVDKNYVDSAITSSPAGTVTSIATNNATGITGGTITSTGTLAIDTALISTRLWRQKGIDSVAALINNNVSGIASYVPKFSGTNTIDTSQLFQDGQNIGLGTTTPNGRLAIVDTGGFALKINYNSASNVSDSNAAIYAENNGLSSYVAIFNEKTTNNTGAQLPLLIESSLTTGTPQANMGTGMDFGTRDDANNRKLNRFIIRGTNPAAATYTSRAEFRLWNNGTQTTPYYWLGNGNMGLGTSTPDSNLTVVNGALFGRGIRASGLPQAPGTKALRIDASGTISYADTLIDAGGTVTSVATNDGTGITGGTITTTGTLAIDTTLISTRAWRQKGVDSLQANINLKLNISDTAAMLSPYLRKVDTTAMLQNYVNNVGYGLDKSGQVVSVDTLEMSTRAWRQKGIDSVAALINNNVSGTTNYVSKFTGTNTIGNSQIFDNGTNVGVGTTSPTQKLDVNGDASFNGVRVGRGAGNSVVNTVVGNNSMTNVTSGTDNTAVGFGALAALTSGGKNTSMGISALTANTSGSLNTAIGESALNSNTSGGNNIGIGSESMKFNTTGGFNVGVGNGAIAYNTSGTYNTSLGYDAGKSPVNAGQFNQTGTYNLYLGSLVRAGGNGNNTNEIVIGAQADGNGSNSVTLGNTSITNTYLRGNINLNTVANATTDTDKFLVSDGGVIKYRTGSELLSDIGGASASSISGTTNYIPKFTSSSAIGNSVIYESSNKIGIGTTSPDSELDILGAGSRLRLDGSLSTFNILSRNTANGATNPLNFDADVYTFNRAGSELMRLTSTGLGIGMSPNASQGKLQINQSLGSSIDGGIRITDNATTSFIFNNVSSGVSALWSSGALAFGSNNGTFSESMRLTSTGLGIGTSSPSRLLDLSSSSSNGTAINIANSATNGRTYVIGSNFVTGNGEFSIYDATASAERLRLDASGNLGLGVTPSAWGANWKALQIGNAAFWSQTASGSGTFVSQNAYFDGANWKYNANYNAAVYIQTSNAEHQWLIAPSGVAGNTISFTQAMTLDASGNLLVGGTSVLGSAKLSIYGKTQNETSLSGDVIGNFVNTSATGFGFRIAGGASGAGYALSVNNYAGTELMKVDGSGNVGIGTTSPSRLLHIDGGASATYFQMSNTASGSGVSDGFQIAQDGANVDLINRENGYITFNTNNTERMRLDASGNLGLGVTPSAWSAGEAAIQTTYGTFIGNSGVNVGANAYYNAGWKYVGNAASSLYAQASGQHQWFNAPSGTAGNAISFTQAMTLDASGRLLIAATSDFGSGTRMLVNGTITAMSSTWNNSNAGGAIQMFSNSADYGTIWALKNGNQAWGNIAIAPSGGNVGIGTTSPNIDGGTATALTINSAASGARLELASGGNRYAQYFAGSSAAYLTTYTSIPLVFETNSSERMRITSGGNVGIGTTSPAHKTEIYGDGTSLYLNGNQTYTNLRFGNTSATAGYIQYTGDNFAFLTNSAERMRIKSSGVINLSNVPSDPTGLATGDIYRDGDGYLKIVL